MSTTKRCAKESDTTVKQPVKTGLNDFMTNLYVIGEVEDFIIILDAICRDNLLAFIWRHAHDILSLDEVNEVYQEILLRIGQRVGKEDDIKTPDSWRCLTFGIAKNTTRETLRKRGNDLKFVRPESDDFYTTPDSDAQHSEMQEEIALAYSNCGLTETEKFVLKTLAENIDEFKTRKVFGPLRAVLAEIFPYGLPEEICTQRRLKSVWLSARRKFRNYLVVRGYTYQRKHDGERNARHGTS